jgi:hypothetical protein
MFIAHDVDRVGRKMDDFLEKLFKTVRNPMRKEMEKLCICWLGNDTLPPSLVVLPSNGVMNCKLCKT